MLESRDTDWSGGKRREKRYRKESSWRGGTHGGGRYETMRIANTTSITWTTQLRDKCIEQQGIMYFDFDAT
jgi:hypothetical protein